VIALSDECQIAEIMRRVREYRGVTASQLARNVHVSRRTIRGRETGEQGYTAASLLETARAFGYMVALLPAPAGAERPAARIPTGTGWPE
jgi:transcriptional regulator with XRE-family HTH domain